MSHEAAVARESNGELTPLQKSEAELNKAIEELRAIPGRAPAAPVVFDNKGTENVLLNIPVEVQIIIGAREMTVAELMALSDGSTVALDRRVGEPADVVVNGVKIAKGEITVMKDDPTRFGFKISELLK